MKKPSWAGGLSRRVAAVAGGVLVAFIAHAGRAQVESPGPPMPGVPTVLAVTTELGGDGSPTMYRLSISGDSRTAGPGGAFYRTTQPISRARLIEVDPPAGRVIPLGSNTRTQLALWNELGEEGKLWPHRAIRHAGSHADRGDGLGPLGNWEDDNHDGVDDLGFVCIGPIDYRIILRYAEFNPVGVTSPGGSAPPASPELEPWLVGEAPIPPGLHADAVDTGNRLYIVQFVTQSLQEYRGALESVGAVVREYQESNADLVEMDQSVAVQVAAQPFVRWVGPYHPMYKLDRDLYARRFSPEGDPAALPPERHVISVFERGLAQKDLVAERIERMGGLLEPYSDQGFTLTAELTPSQLLHVLRLGEVLWVDPWQPRIFGGRPDCSDLDCPELGAEPCPSLAHILNGIDQIHALNFKGQLVRGAAYEYAFQRYLPDFQHFGPNPTDTLPPTLLDCTSSTPFPICPEVGDSHGTAVFGILFGNNPNCQRARGVLPEALEGIWATFGEAGCTEAASIAVLDTVEQAVFETSSTGSTLPTDPCDVDAPLQIAYTGTTRDLDNAVFEHDFLFCQMMYQRQANPACHECLPPLPPQRCCGPLCCPIGGTAQSWAKNVVSVGGVKLSGSTNRSNHCWSCDGNEPFIAGAGSSADGRIKPDLVNVYDGVPTVSVQCIGLTQCLPAPLCGQGCQGFGPCFMSDCTMTETYTRGYCRFGGTSAATPLTAGCFGLLFQMWHLQVFPGFGGGASVYASKPKAATAKALMINTAFQYPIQNPAPACGSVNDFTRFNQGWGMPSLKGRIVDAQLEHRGLYDQKDRMLIINQSPILTTVGQSVTYEVTSDATMPLKATLVYRDPAAAAGAVVTRVNDFDLVVRKQSAGLAYMGNRGLLAANWNIVGEKAGAQDVRNTVENVFIQNPPAGTWTVEVRLSALPLGPGADFSLVVSGIVPTASHRGPDWNADGVVDASDFSSFLIDYLEGKADVDGDGKTGSSDLFVFIARFLSRE